MQLGVYNMSPSLGLGEFYVGQLRTQNSEVPVSHPCSHYNKSVRCILLQ